MFDGLLNMQTKTEHFRAPSPAGEKTNRERERDRDTERDGERETERERKRERIIYAGLPSEGEMGGE